MTVLGTSLINWKGMCNPIPKSKIQFSKGYWFQIQSDLHNPPLVYPAFCSSDQKLFATDLALEKCPSVTIWNKAILQNCLGTNGGGLTRSGCTYFKEFQNPKFQKLKIPNKTISHRVSKFKFKMTEIQNTKLPFSPILKLEHGIKKKTSEK